MPEQLRFEVTPTPVRVNEPLLTAKDAASMLAVRESWVQDAARRRELPSIRVGKHLRFLHSDLESWVARQRTDT